MDEPRKKEFRKEIVGTSITGKLKPKLPHIYVVIAVFVALFLCGGVKTFFRDPFEFFGNILIGGLEFVIIGTLILLPLSWIILRFEFALDIATKISQFSSIIFNLSYDPHLEVEKACDKSVKDLPTEKNICKVR